MCTNKKFEMNIIKVENVRRINGFVNRLQVLSDYKYNPNKSTIVVLSEDDILNENSLIKLRGFIISSLLLPKKYKYTFNDTKVGKLIVPNLEKNNVISYY